MSKRIFTDSEPVLDANANKRIRLRMADERDAPVPEISGYNPDDDLEGPLFFYIPPPDPAMRIEADINLRAPVVEVAAPVEVPEPMEALIAPAAAAAAPAPAPAPAPEVIDLTAPAPAPAPAPAEVIDLTTENNDQDDNRSGSVYLPDGSDSDTSSEVSLVPSVLSVYSVEEDNDSQATVFNNDWQSKTVIVL
jgi:hypothetical protein